jgi:hypothetical protein
MSLFRVIQVVVGSNATTSFRRMLMNAIYVGVLSHNLHVCCNDRPDELVDDAAFLPPSMDMITELFGPFLVRFTPICF